MKQYRFPPTSGFVKFITIVVIIIAASVSGSVYFVYEDLGGYITASVTGVILVVLLLRMFTLPRKIRITDDYFEIVCLFKWCRIPLNEITEVRRIPTDRQKKFIPLWSLYGVFGYTGWYYNGGLARLYATRLSNLIEITTHNNRIVISDFKFQISDYFRLF